MREPARDRARLQHILGAIEKVQEYTQNVESAEKLDADSMRKHATTYNLQVIGEAVYKLTAEFRNAHPNTPWAIIEKSRHVLVHDYYQIDTSILWNIIHEDLEPLKSQIADYLKEFED